MSDGHSYTTISAEPGQPVRIRVDLYLGADAWIAFCRSPARPGGVTGQDARMARMLADQAAAYAAEVERLAAASTTDDAAA